MQIRIATPSTFNFKRTVVSHGWLDLLPFGFDQDSWTLSRVLEVGNGAPANVKITAVKREVRIDANARLSKSSAQKVVADVRHMLRLDDDMSVFYRTMKAE